MGPKISLVYENVADQSVTNSIVPVPINGLIYPFPANQRVKLICVIAFTLGAVGGYRFRMDLPVGVLYQLKIYEFVDASPYPGAQFSQVQTTTTDFTDPGGGVAGNAYIRLNATIINGPNAGDLQLDVAQNNANAVPITVLRGSTMNIDVF